MNEIPKPGTPEFWEYTGQLRQELEAAYRRQREAEAAAAKKLAAAQAAARTAYDERKSVQRLADRKRRYQDDLGYERAAARERMRQLRAARRRQG